MKRAKLKVAWQSEALPERSQLIQFFPSQLKLFRGCNLVSQHSLWPWSVSCPAAATMDPVSMAASLSPLVGAGSKLVQLAHQVAQQYVESELLICSIAAESSTVMVAFAQLQKIIVSRTEQSWKQDGQEDILRSIDAVITACSLTLSVLEKYLRRAEDAAKTAADRGDGGNPAEWSLKKREKMRVV